MPKLSDLVKLLFESDFKSQALREEFERTLTESKFRLFINGDSEPQLMQGPQIVMSYERPQDLGCFIFPWTTTPNADLQKQIDAYDSRIPILAHHPTCRCWRCMK